MAVSHRAAPPTASAPDEIRALADRAPTEGDPAPHGGPDPESRRWVARLGSAGADRDAALAELHGLLVGAARFASDRRGSQLEREGVADLVVQAADDALVSILARLEDYRGESRFTTWAWKFAFYEACVSIRKRRWLRREVPVDVTDWDVLARDAPPDRRVEQLELIAAIRAATETALTPHQRRVFVALAVNEVPVDVLAERLGTTRGALYKTLHDSRGRVRAALAAQGLGPDAWQAGSTRPHG